ncbi:MAG: T9SS C-terminal target domain-containing protein [Calditrichaeota bacterium]|nr:MAG: T9SS C-terminal target domain-containing protein [Calditrichota bacterium]
MKKSFTISDLAFTRKSIGKFVFSVVAGCSLLVSSVSLTEVYGQCVTTFPYSQNFDNNADFPPSTSTTGTTPAVGTGWTTGVADFKWAVDTGTTGSSLTGPSGDNTSGSGYYAYTEATSNFNKTAILYSPCFDISGLAAPQLSFWYHMYGADMGDLIIDIVDENDVSIATDIFSISGQQQTSSADAWLEATVSLTPYKANGQIRICFRGVTGPQYTSDMAFDDVLVGEAPSVDAQILSVTAGGPYAESSTMSIDVQVQNNGADPLEGNINLDLTNDGSTDFTQAFAGLGSGLTTTVNFSVTAPGTAGSYTASATVVVVGDGNPLNDSGSDTYDVVPGCVTSYPFNETFDGFASGNGAFTPSTGWLNSTNSTAASYNWTVDASGTPSSPTGPSDDVSNQLSGTTGNYVFVETSSGADGDVTTLLSPCFNLASLTTPQASFWYHMFGDLIGDLHVDIVNNETGVDVVTSAWSQSGAVQTSSADLWLEQLIDLTPAAGLSINLRFRYIKNGGCCTGDAAIDHLTVREAPSVDVQVLSVNIGGPFGEGTAMTVDVQVQNNAGELVSGDVNLDLTDDGSTDFTLPFADLGAGANTTVTFNVTAPGTAGSYTASATTVAAGDGNPLNDSGSDTYDVVPGCVTTYPFNETFDGFASGNGAFTAVTGWTNSTNSSAAGYNWTVDDSGTPSSPTGPANDVTNQLSGSTGNYVFVETSSGSNGDVTTLLSPCFDLTSLTTPQASFWYHMFGALIGDLHVDIVNNETGVDIVTSAWSQSGAVQTASADPFLEQLIDLSPAAGLAINLRFRYIKNGGCCTGDAAIDHLTVREAPNVDAEITSVTVVEPTYPSVVMTVNVDVLNNSVDPIEGSVNFDIDNDGTDESTGTSFAGLASGATTTVVITTNSPATIGSFTGKATVVVAGDGNVNNNSGIDSYTVSHADDMAITSVNAPAVADGTPTMSVDVVVTNNGLNPATGNVSLDLTTDGSSDGTETVTELASGASTTVTFSGLTTPALGSYTATATITQTDATDTNNGNDSGTGTFNVTPGCVTTFPYTQDFESTAEFPTATSATTNGNPNITTGWINGSGDFDWGYDSGTTVSSNTGPTVDNTLGTSSGRYAYTEASSPNNNMDTAILYSPCFDISGLTNPSLSFFYHMFGQTMGDLHIDIVQEDLTTIAASVLTLTGQQQAATGDPWLESIVDLTAYVGSGQVRVCFRAITGSDFYSDICIDDVMVQDLVGGSAPTITHTPISSNSEGNTATVTADINDVDGDLASGENAPTVWYRVNGGAFNSVSMTSAPSPSSQGIVDVKRVESKSKAQITSSKKYGNNQVFATFSADIPAQTGNDLVEYYIAAQDEASNVKTAPNGGSGLTPPGSTPPGSFYSYTVTPPPPANDDCANAIEITNWTTQITGNTAQATQDATDNQSCGGSSTHKSVWYKFTIPAGENWNVSFDLSGSSYDTAMELFSGTCGGGLTSIVCDDDGAGTTTQSRIPENSGTIGITAGNYYLLVSGYNSNSGDYTLQPTCNQILPPVNNGGAPLGNGSNPVNTNGGTTPVVDIILNGGANNPTSITVNTSAGTTPGGFQNGVSRTFNIQTTGGTNFTTDLKFYFLATEAAAGMSVGTTAKVWRKDGSTWVEVGSGTVVNEGGSPEWWSVTITGVSSTAPSSDKHVGNLSAVDGEFGIANDGDSPLFVELAYLNVKQEKQSAVLSWGTESEVDNIGFEIYRRDSDNSEFSLIASYRTHEVLKGAGNSSLPIDYSFVDDNVVVGKTYTYKLVDVDADLFETAHEVVSLTIDYSKATVIDRFVLRQNYPNPFNPETTISFEVPNVTSSMSRVEISIFNIKGQVVRNLVNQAYSGGLHSVVWDGKDNSGKSLASGVYFFKLRTNDNQLTRKMLLLK